jgi:hypothetical protein
VDAGTVKPGPELPNTAISMLNSRDILKQAVSLRCKPLEEHDNAYRITGLEE